MTKLFAVSLLFFAALPAMAANDCDAARTLAANAAAYRDEGLTQEQLRYPLPPRDYFATDSGNPKNAQLQLMHQIVDELYLDPEVQGDLYATFKAEQCRLLSATPAQAADFPSAASKLKACTPLKGRQRAACAAEAAGLVVPGNGP